jgi:medium-chain acyl-[acyl-carrier-protein] hydrolase
MTSFSAVEANKWLIPIRKEDSPHIRLITFHWVGGNGFAYRPWKKELLGNIEIYSMMLPGRLSRRKEEFVETVDEVVSRLLLSMQALGLTGGKTGLDQPPTVFFGHSYGGIIAYELALQLQQQDLLRVAHLVISSTNSPEVLTSRSCSTDDAFYKKLHLVNICELTKHTHPTLNAMKLTLSPLSLCCCCCCITSQHNTSHLAL